jgi:hypothetical protein
MMKFLLKMAIFALIFPSLTLALPADPLQVTLRQGGLIFTGIAISLAGLYTLCKKSEGTPHKITHTCAGITGILAGIATICLSHELITELDALFEFPAAP